MKRPNISVMRIPQNAEREAGFENVFNEIIKKKLPKCGERIRQQNRGWLQNSQHS